MAGTLPYAAATGGDGVQQSFYMGQMDFWTEQAVGAPPGWTHVAPGHATLSFLPQNMARDPTPAPLKPAQAAVFDKTSWRAGLAQARAALRRKAGKCQAKGRAREAHRPEDFTLAKDAQIASRVPVNPADCNVRA